MNEHIEWMKQKLAEAQEQVNIWSAALKLVEGQEEEKLKAIQQKKVTGRPTSVSAIIEEILRKKGPLGAKDIFEAVEKRGKKTTYHRIGCLLSVWKGKRFFHNVEAKTWDVLDTEQSNGNVKAALDLLQTKHKKPRSIRVKTIQDMVEEILQELGPSTVDTILHEMISRGKQTTKASLSAILGQGKPEKFNKDEHSKRWFAVKSSPADDIRYMNV